MEKFEVDQIIYQDKGVVEYANGEIAEAVLDGRREVPERDPHSYTVFLDTGKKMLEKVYNHVCHLKIIRFLEYRGDKENLIVIR